MLNVWNLHVVSAHGLNVRNLMELNAGWDLNVGLGDSSKDVVHFDVVHFVHSDVVHFDVVHFEQVVHFDEQKVHCAHFAHFCSQICMKNHPFVQIAHHLC